MKNAKISKLPIIPHGYDLENFEHTGYTPTGEGMTCDERKFVHGLIRYYEPKRVLEIGVFNGWGSVNILNAISDRDSLLVSIDIGKEGVGGAVTKNKEKWRLITGVDPSQVMEQLDMKFDFCVIDALHIHPCESLNFISVLPWLADGAIVVVHDTIVYMQTMWTNTPCYAPRILISSVCADKLEPDFHSWLDHPNIYAFQVTQDTRKYIQNVFDSLFLPWGRELDNNIVTSVRLLVEKHYSEKQLILFNKAIDFNQKLSDHKFCCKLESHDIVIYGAGFCGKQTVEEILCVVKDFKCTIWDTNADSIKQIYGLPVSYPDFETRAKNGQIMIITILNDRIAAQIRSQFEPLGYTVYHGISEFIVHTKI